MEMKEIRRMLLLLVVAVGLLSCTDADRYVTISGYAQGGTYSVKFNMKDVKVSPEQIRDSVDSILRAVDRSLSGYNRNSLLSRFNEGEGIVPDSLFADMFSKAYSVYEKTGGVVDAASAPLFDMWGFGFKAGELPSAEDVERVKAGCGMDRMCPEIVPGPSGKIDPAQMLLPHLRKDDAPLPELNYNAIAQGYSCDLVASYLYSIGVKDMMVDIGEIYCDGLNPSGRSWSIGIDAPVDGNNEPGAMIQAVFNVPEGPHGVVTSGNYRKFYVRDGRKYAHTIDPRTGFPVEHNLLSATVLAPDAMWADAYATYCMVVGLEEAVSFIESQPGIEGCLIYDGEDGLASWRSSGFLLVK